MHFLEISREYYADRTLGTMSYNGSKICYCIEPAETDEPQAISCIPEGHYPVLIRRTNELGLHLYITDVPVLGYVLVHAAFNSKMDLSRSIIPVTGFSEKGNGLFSSNAMEKLMRILKPDLLTSIPVTLFITNKPPGHEIKTLSEYVGDVNAAYAG